jgi:hypothetical protein
MVLVGFIVGRATTSGTGSTVTVEKTVERSIVVSAQHLGSARDPVDAGPLDLARVSARRRGALLVTTIVARRPWPNSLLRRGHVSLSIDYDTNRDDKADRRDVVFLFNGRPTSWISTLGQGVMYATVTRPSRTTITVARDASVFYSASGQGGRLFTSPIGVAVVARWHGGRDRVPNHGWITVPPPTEEAAASTAPPAQTAPVPTATASNPNPPKACPDAGKALARIERDIAAIRHAASLPAANTLLGNHAINVATDRFLNDIARAPIDNLRRNRLIDRAAAAVAGSCQQCFQALEAERPIPAIRMGETGCATK